MGGRLCAGAGDQGVIDGGISRQKRGLKSPLNRNENVPQHARTGGTDNPKGELCCDENPQAAGCLSERHRLRTRAAPSNGHSGAEIGSRAEASLLASDDLL